MSPGFLILRLRSVLGRRTGDEDARRRRAEERYNISRRDSPTEDHGNVIELPGRSQQAQTPEELDLGSYEGTPQEEGIRAIHGRDPSFNPNGFLMGARTAFEMIVEAFAHGDKETLRPLLADEVYHGFASAIDERVAAGQTMETRILGITKLEIQEAALRGNDAVVTVLFQSEQLNMVLDAEGNVIEGDEKNPTDVTDVWTFTRDVTSPDPNWKLTATTAPE